MPRSKEVASPSRFLNILSNKPKAAKHNKIIIIGFMHSFYYNNEKNEGEIYFQMINYGVRPLKIKKGERIGQGIFMPYLKADNDEPVQRQRLGGFGSSGTRNEE